MLVAPTGPAPSASCLTQTNERSGRAANESPDALGDEARKIEGVTTAFLGLSRATAALSPVSAKASIIGSAKVVGARIVDALEVAPGHLVSQIALLLLCCCTLYRRGLSVFGVICMVAHSSQLPPSPGRLHGLLAATTRTRRHPRRCRPPVRRWARRCRRSCRASRRPRRTPTTRPTPPATPPSTRCTTRSPCSRVWTVMRVLCKVVVVFSCVFVTYGVSPRLVSYRRV